MPNVPGFMKSSSADPRSSRDRVIALLERMTGQQILVVGDAMLDVYLTGDAERISPEAPVPVVRVRARRYGLGGAANVAANVAAIGAECRLVAVIGDDVPGEVLRAELERSQLSHEYIVPVSGRPTTSKTRVAARGQQVVRIDEEVDDPIPPPTEAKVAAQLERAMSGTSAVLIEDYNKGTLTPLVIELAMSVARRRRVPVVVDPKFKNFFAYSGATVFKPNRHELEQAMGASLDLAQVQALPRSREMLGVECLLLTLGSDGMVLVTKDADTTHIPAIAREVFDVSGAGDTVTAWVGSALGAGASVYEAAQLANYAAGIEVGKLGVATVSPAEVLAAHDTRYDPPGELRRGGLL